MLTRHTITLHRNQVLWSATFIVRACNAHDGLLAALENLLAEVCTTEAGLSATTPLAREHAAQAIARARGEA